MGDTNSIPGGATGSIPVKAFGVEFGNLESKDGKVSIRSALALIEAAVSDYGRYKTHVEPSILKAISDDKKTVDSEITPKELGEIAPHIVVGLAYQGIKMKAVDGNYYDYAMGEVYKNNSGIDTNKLKSAVEASMPKDSVAVASKQPEGISPNIIP